MMVMYNGILYIWLFLTWLNLTPIGRLIQLVIIMRQSLSVLYWLNITRAPTLAAKDVNMMIMYNISLYIRLYLNWLINWQNNVKTKPGINLTRNFDFCYILNKNPLIEGALYCHFYQATNIMLNYEYCFHTKISVYIY